MLPAYLRKALLPLCTLSVLAGCGGGDGDSPSPPPPNRAPVLTTTTFAATEDVAFAGQLVATDADNNVLTYTRVTDVQHGQITIAATGAVAYTPAANYSGADSFSVSVTDGAGGQVTGTVTINVAAVNDAPTFNSPVLGTAEEVPLDSNVALYAADVEANAMTFAIATAPAHGALTVSAAGMALYTPAANYNGADSFSVRVSDSGGGEVIGTVTINVTAVNDAPTFNAPVLSTDEDTPLDSSVALYAADADANAMTFAMTTAPAHGTLTMSAAGIGLYTPAANYNGADSFSVRVSDGFGGEVIGAVSINVAAINDSPVLTTTQLSVAEDGVLTAQLAATDVENQSVLFQVGGAAAHGQVSITPSGQLTYTPDANYFGADGLMVGLTDDGGSLTLRPLSITVDPVNDAPVAFEDLLRLPANAVVTLPVLANDSDADGDNLIVTILTQPGGGTLTVTNSNEITFTRDNQFNGPIRFRYRVTDAGGITAEADVRAVIGEFPGIYYLSDETTVGQAEVHWFDGLSVSRIGRDLAAGEQVTSFSMAGDGQTVAFVVEDADVARVRFTGPGAADAPVIFTSSPKAGSPLHPFVQLNRNGTYLLVTDPYAAGGTATYIVRVADGFQTRVGSSTPQVVRLGNYFAFNPANDDFYIQAQVGGSPPPMSGTGFLTLFRGNSASAATLTQIGLTYPTPSNGGGSGMEIAITAEGRFVFHQEVLYSPSVKSSVLVYDSLVNLEAPVYRRPVFGEIGMWNGFSLSKDGARVCFLFREPGVGSSGPSRIVSGDPFFPSVAAPITPIFEYGYDCRFSADNHTIFYWASTAAEPRPQVYAVDASAPGTPVVSNRPLVSGEELENWWVARDGQRQVFGTRTGTPTSSLYSVSAVAPSTFIPFATNFFDDGSRPGQLDGGGYVLAYSKRPSPGSGLRRLTMLSTQSASYVFSLTRPDSSTGVVQFQWAP